jgi:hypothetical protein
MPMVKNNEDIGIDVFYLMSILSILVGIALASHEHRGFNIE